ncbi:uncharacterized protein LOC132793213 [Drosophila nasuta]|uniref:uncharacterized protein LOC132793213 n=1 Tax=Drosophila nasuta TaxID=42062 RepID=UPI00295E2D89|nr:uncharacterized protein LOC132793213 [Drosophila nasuta]
MNHFSALCLFLVTLAVANASVLPVKRNHLPAVNQQGEVVWLDEMSHSVPDKCDFSCTDQDLSVCAHNGQCLQLFTSRCTMAAYNCRNPQKRFNIVENYKCTLGYVPLCSPEERKELGITM